MYFLKAKGCEAVNNYNSPLLSAVSRAVVLFTYGQLLSKNI